MVKKKQRRKRVVITPPSNIISDDFIIPNHSGDHGYMTAKQLNLGKISETDKSISALNIIADDTYAQAITFHGRTPGGRSTIRWEDENGNSIAQMAAHTSTDSSGTGEHWQIYTTNASGVLLNRFWIQGNVNNNLARFSCMLEAKNTNDGICFLVDQNKDYNAIEIDSEATTKAGIQIAMLDATKTAINTTGGITVNGSTKMDHTSFPVLDIQRNATGSGGVYGGIRLRRNMGGATALVNGIGMYFDATDSAGNVSFAGFLGGRLSTVTSGSEIGDIILAPSYHQIDPYARTDFLIRATGTSTSKIIFNGGGDLDIGSSDIKTTGDITGGNGATGSFTTVDGKTVTVTSGIITAIV